MEVVYILFCALYALLCLNFYLNLQKKKYAKENNNKRYC